MGVRRWRRYDGGVRRYFTRRCVGMHVTLLILLPTFAFLTKWQLDRALGGNTLSWAYTFEWPLFALYAVYVWWQLIHDQSAPGLRGGPVSSRTPSSVDGSTGGDAPSDDHDRPGWALSGGWKRNVAVAASSAIDADTGGRGERYVPQTAEEAAALAEYNRYLAELNSVRRRFLPSMTESTPEVRRLGRPSMARLFDRGMEGALIRYRVMTFIVGSALIVLVFVGVPLQVWGHFDLVAKVEGTIHGYLYLVYLFSAADVARRAHWRIGRILAVVLSGFVPFLAFIVEHRVYRQMQEEWVVDASGTAVEVAGQPTEVAGGAGETP